MKTQQIWIFGLATLGLALAAPAQAAPDFMEGAFMVSKNDKGGDLREDARDAGKDKRGSSSKKSKAEREEPQGYGYGYERREQERYEEDSRSRGRR